MQFTVRMRDFGCKLSVLLIVILVVLGYNFYRFRPLQVIEDNYLELMKQLNAERVAQDDPRLIKLIRDYYIRPPSDLPYSLKKPHLTHFSQFRQSLYIDDLLDKMENGFFVECGAFDGEKHSNTLFFERERKWTGLLIEADPVYYRHLEHKKRKAFSINACLSVEPYPSEVTFSRNVREYGRVVHNQVAIDWINQNNFKKDEIQVQCFPLYSILLALNRTSVDYLSLDIEGDELYVLKTVPFDKVDIKSMTVECEHHLTEGRELQSYLDSQGYQNVSMLTIDMAFVKKT